MKTNTVNKPNFIEGIYAASVSFDVEEVEKELNISWEDVKDFYIKWCCLFLIMKDGQVLEVKKEPEEVDWKRPYETNLLDHNYDAME